MAGGGVAVRSDHAGKGVLPIGCVDHVRRGLARGGGQDVELAAQRVLIVGELRRAGDDRAVPGGDGPVQLGMAGGQSHDVQSRLACGGRQDIEAFCEVFLVVVETGDPSADLVAASGQRALKGVLGERYRGEVRVGPIHDARHAGEIRLHGLLILGHPGGLSGDRLVHGRVQLDHALDVHRRLVGSLMKTIHARLHRLLEGRLAIVQCEHGQGGLAGGRREEIHLAPKGLLVLGQSGHASRHRVIVIQLLPTEGVLRRGHCAQFRGHLPGPDAEVCDRGIRAPVVVGDRGCVGGQFRSHRIGFDADLFDA